MSSGNCSVCAKVAEPSYSISFDKCGCSVHADCVGAEETDYLTCPACASGITTTPPLAEEPRPHDGIDYVLNPGLKKGNGNGFIATALSYVKKQPPASTKAPVTFASLVQKHVPIATIMSQYKLGLQHGLKEGILIEDFLSAGYKLSDLAAFEDVGKLGPDRGRQTLIDALGLNATHVRDFPHAVSMKEINALTGVSTADELGLYFATNNGTLECYGDTRWNAKDCVRLGLTIENLLDMGMQTIDQYQDLMRDLPRAEQKRTEVQLGVKMEHLESLMHVEMEEEEVEMAIPKKKKAVIAAPAPPTASRVDDETSLRRLAQEKAKSVVIKKAPLF